MVEDDYLAKFLGERLLFERPWSTKGENMNVRRRLRSNLNLPATVCHSAIQEHYLCFALCVIGMPHHVKKVYEDME